MDPKAQKDLGSAPVKTKSDSKTTKRIMAALSNSLCNFCFLLACPKRVLRKAFRKIRRTFSATATKKSSYSTKNGHESDEQAEEIPNDRRDFEAIRSITSETIEELILNILYSGDTSGGHTFHVGPRQEGSFNHCVFLDVKKHGELENSYVLKIPAHGTAGEWQEGDAFMLRNEAVLMQHMRHHTDCPVPEVVAFDETLDNSISAPFILMKKLEGISAEDLWVGRTLVGPDMTQEQEMQAGDAPWQELDQLRVNFLESLANAMSKIQDLQFQHIGVPIFENPEDDQPIDIGPAWRWHSKSTMKELAPVGPFNTSRQFFKAGLNNILGYEENAGLDEDPNDPGLLGLAGARKLLNMVLAAPPFAVPRLKRPFHFLDIEDVQNPNSPQYHFVLRHDDLNLQNILVDADGNVQGIIDWDGCITAPRFMGYSSLPTFLRRDRLGGEVTEWPYMSWSLPRYRSIYTEAMKNACHPDNTDVKYTAKSDIYQALYGVLDDDESVLTVISKLLLDIEEFRHADATDICIKLGRGCLELRRLLEEKIVELLSPEGQ